MTENKELINKTENDGATSDTVTEAMGDGARSHHSHSHHGHHSHSSSRHHSKKRRTRKNPKKYNKAPLDRGTIIKICSVIAVFVAIATIILVINYIENKEEEAISKFEEVVFDGESVVINRVYINSVDLISDVAKAYLEKGPDTDFLDVLEGLNNPEGPYDIARPVVLTPEIYNVPEEKIYGYLVEISKNDDFSSSNTYFFKFDEEIEIDNLYTACEYFYRISIISSPDEKDIVFTVIGSFTTSDTPRILSVDGISNVRDIGGWKTIDGKRIRQGLLFRGTELDGIVQSQYRITDKGIDVMTDTLGVKFEMDLRGEHENPTGVEMLSPDITHKYYSVNMYKSIFTDEARFKIKNVFSDLANPDNYPIYMHCTYGLDRTGTICYLLEALLGVSEEDLLMEYKLSDLFYLTTDTNDFETMHISMSAYPGETSREKVENYLLECGVTPEEIASIREIFLVDEELYNAE